MLENLRLHIGTSYARFHFRTARDPIVRFTEAISQARRPVVFLPELSSEASEVDVVLKFLGQRSQIGDFFGGAEALQTVLVDDKGNCVEPLMGNKE